MIIKVIIKDMSAKPVNCPITSGRAKRARSFGKN
jgi:hypothetical protein